MTRSASSPGALPDWNDLTNEARREAVKAAEFHCHCCGFDPGQCAVDVYGAIRRNARLAVFPLFTYPRDDAWAGNKNLDKEPTP
jgi:hypothetical protein